MTEAEFNLANKNVRQWSLFIKKVERKAKEAERELTEDEEDNLGMRRAYITIWADQVKQCKKRGFSGAPVEGAMAVAGSAVETGEKAVATEE